MEGGRGRAREERGANERTAIVEGGNSRTQRRSSKRATSNTNLEEKRPKKRSRKTSSKKTSSEPTPEGEGPSSENGRSNPEGVVPTTGNHTAAGPPGNQGDTTTSTVPPQPEILQFFVKTLNGQTACVREDIHMLVGEVKNMFLAGRGDGQGSVYLTCEGKTLDEDLTLWEARLAEGSTLRMCVRFQSTLYKGASKHAATLQALVKDIILETSTAGKRRALLTGALKELHQFLRPSNLDAEHFSPAEYVLTFVSVGGLEAITSLLFSKTGFLGLSCVQLICHSIEKLPEDDPNRPPAVHLGWHLLASLLEKPWPLETETLESCINSLSCLVRVRTLDDADVLNALPPREGKKSWAQMFMDLLIRLGRKFRVEVEGDVEVFAKGDGGPGGRGAYPMLPSLMQYLATFSVSDSDQPFFDKSVRKLFRTLVKALQALLGSAVETAIDREMAAQIVNAVAAPEDSGTIDFSHTPHLRESLHQLPHHLLSYIIACFEAVLTLAGIQPGLEEKLRKLMRERIQVITSLLLLRTEDFQGMQELRIVFTRPYRHLWPLNLKERWLHENIPVFCPVTAYQVAVRRDANLLTDAFNQIGSADPRELRQGINVNFQDEEGYGPGVTREFFTKVAEKLFNPEFALFRTAPSDRRRVFPNPDSGFNANHLAYFRFCGRFITLAIAHRVQIGVTFCSALLDAMWGARDEATDWDTAGHRAARDIDPQLFEVCEKLLRMPKAEFDQLGLTFCYTRESLGVHSEEDLIPGGREIEVKSDRRAEFVQLKVQKQLLEPVEEQINALREGMESLYTNEGWGWHAVYGVLTEKEFATLLQGDQTDLSIDDWKEHTTYHGYAPDDKVIKRFWRAVRSLTPLQRRNLLHFATAVRFLPSTGFAGLPERFHIHCAETSLESLPTSHTCYFQLMLPRYLSTKMMTARLLLVTQQHVAEGFGTV